MHTHTHSGLTRASLSVRQALCVREATALVMFALFVTCQGEPVTLNGLTPEAYLRPMNPFLFRQALRVREATALVMPALFATCQGEPVTLTRVKGALQLLSNRHM